MTERRTLEDLRKLSAAVQAAETALDEARLARDAAIRDVRRQSEHTIAEIAGAAGVSLATVKVVVRGLR